MVPTLLDGMHLWSSSTYILTPTTVAHTIGVVACMCVVWSSSVRGRRPGVLVLLVMS